MSSIFTFRTMVAALILALPTQMLADSQLISLQKNTDTINAQLLELLELEKKVQELNDALQKLADIEAKVNNINDAEMKSQLENPDTATRLDYEYYTSHNDANLLTNASQSGNKQAFALSVSDIQAIEDNPKLLNFLEPNWFWLRSPGNIFSTGTSVIDEKLNIVTATDGGFPIRPALWVSVYPN